MANRFVLNTISYHGSGAIKEIPGELQRRGYKKIFVCSDPDLVKFGVTAKVTDELDAAGIAWSLYSEIKPNPTIQNVKDGVEAFKAAEADAIVTIGGGSSMDTAKAIGIIINNPEFADVRSLEGVAPTKNHAVFTIAVPTTAGTAAEVTINYVITDPEKVRKFVCVDTNDAPEVAVVDPDMMASMPAGLTASTGMDALTHAIEGYTTKGAWELSDMFHFEAIKLISENLRDSVAEAKSGQPGSGREGMALGQYVAGMGFSNVGLGIDHAMAHTLSAHYDTPHGVACAMLLPIAMEFNKPVCAERLAKVAVAMGVDTTGMSEDEANTFMEEYNALPYEDIDATLTEKGFTAEEIEAFQQAEGTARSSQMIFETLGLTAEDIEAGALSISLINVRAYGMALIKPAEGKEETVLSACQNFVELQQKNFETYLQDQYAIAKNAKCETINGYVVMVMGENSDAIYQSISDTLNAK